MENVINVENVTPENGKVTRTYSQKMSNFFRLGKEIKISPKATAMVNAPGYKQEFFVESVSVLIGIGKNHSADLIMSKEAWEALKNGEEISITTTQEFKKYL